MSVIEWIETIAILVLSVANGILIWSILQRSSRIGPSTIRIMRDPEHGGAAIPKRAHDHDAGIDVHAAISAPIAIEPGGRRKIPIGWCIAIPPGYAGFIAPRSGLADRDGVIAVLGTIDSGYRGGLAVNLVNHGDKTVTIRQGDRIAQLVVAPVWLGRCEVVEALDATDRGANGFGSTGR